MADSADNGFLLDGIVNTPQASAAPRSPGQMASAVANELLDAINDGHVQPSQSEMILADGRDEGQDENAAEDAPGNEAVSATDEASGDPDPDIDEALIARAERAGLDFDEIKAIGHRAGIESAIQMAYRFRGGKNQPARDAAPARDYEEREPQRRAQEPQPRDVRETEFTLPDMEGIDPSIAGAIKAVADHYKQTATEYRQALQDIFRELGAARFKSDVREFDVVLKSWGDEWKDVLGSGESRPGRLSREHLENRDRLFGAARNLRAADPELSWDDALEMTRGRLFKEHQAKVELIARNRKKSAANSKSIARPAANGKPVDAMTAQLRVNQRALEQWKPRRA